jgi:hypothetical protein
MKAVGTENVHIIGRMILLILSTSADITFTDKIHAYKCIFGLVIIPIILGLFTCKYYAN